MFQSAKEPKGWQKCAHDVVETGKAKKEKKRKGDLDWVSVLF